MRSRTRLHVNDSWLVVSAIVVILFFLEAPASALALGGVGVIYVIYKFIQSR
jgi:hypothetical protein